MKGSSIVATIVTAALPVLVTAPAHAQDRQQDAPPARQNCAAAAPQARPSPPRDQARQAQNGENLSDQLSKSEGVICPPQAPDPGIAVPPPGGGTTPVIPPPGSPGGDPSVRPK